MATVIDFMPRAAALAPAALPPDKAAASVREILAYVLGQAEAAGLVVTAQAVMLAIHCIGRDLDPGVLPGFAAEGRDDGESLD